jgi:D-inositol-3-phosphate glycosyltransferase
VSKSPGDQGLAIDLVFPRFKLLSGAERLALELAGGLARAGHRPRIICHQFDSSCAELQQPGVEIVETGARLDWFRNRYLNAIFDYASVSRLRRWLDPDADAVVLFGPSLRLAPGLRRSGGPAVVYHCFEPPRALYQDRADVLARAGAARLLLAPALALYLRLDRRLVRAPGAITASGPYAAERVKAVYGRTAVAITHGVDRVALDAAGDEPSPASVVTVNYLHPRKRVDLALRALALLSEPLGNDSGPPTLRVVGDGPERETLEHLATELGIRDRVHFAGFVPGTELGATYRAARCYLHTAREESFGLSVIEAAYCGLPAVVVGEGGVVDNVVPDTTGYVTASTPEDLAESLARVLTDPQRAQAMGAAGRALVDDRYTWERGTVDLLSAVRAAQ